MNNVARRVIAKAGGAALVAQDAGVSIVSVHRWTYDVEAGGTGGRIPAQRQQSILLGARARGKDLRPEDFFDLPDGLPPLGSAANDNSRAIANDNHAPTVARAESRSHARDGGPNAQQSHAMSGSPLPPVSPIASRSEEKSCRD